MTKPQVIVGNLDCEWQWARAKARTEGRRIRPLPPAVLERVSRLATLLRVFAEEGDLLWTPRPVAPACMRPVAGLPLPNLIGGDSRRPMQDIRVAWAESSAVVERLNHRAFAHRLATEIGCADPGAALITGPGDLERHLPVDGAWVLKAPLSAAGRDRVRGHGKDLDEAARARVTRMFAEHGAALLQPWVKRLADVGFGASGRPHGIDVDPRGGFRGILVPGPALTAAEETQVGQVRRAVCDALDRAGHDGPWCVDAWRYQGPSGDAAFQPLGELNVRLTFGLVARALHERVVRPHWGAESDFALRFGDREEASDPDQVIPLVGAPDAPRMHAWLERLATTVSA